MHIKGSNTTTFGFILLPTSATFTLTLCHTFRNICDTFVTYLYTYLLRNLYTYMPLTK